MNRKDLIRKYKEREVTGGVYRILNTLNNKYLLASGIDIKGDRIVLIFLLLLAPVCR